MHLTRLCLGDCNTAMMTRTAVGPRRLRAAQPGSVSECSPRCLFGGRALQSMDLSRRCKQPGLVRNVLLPV